MAAHAEHESLFQRFFRANTRLSLEVQDRLGLESDTEFYDEFERRLEQAVRAVPDGATIVDVGGGRSCVFASLVPRDRGARVVAVDISPEELAANRDVDETRVADVAESLPFGDGEVDLVVTRTLLEHVDGVPAAIENIGRIVKPGGATLHLVPGRYSLFGTAARVLPFGPTKRLLHRVIPETKGTVEFETYYDHCYPAGLERAFRGAGFRTVKVEKCWSQTNYFAPFFPVYLLVAAYQAITRALGIDTVAAYMIVRAER
jgi:ubiquinone/menaquinone biosynthesis C-methylase UbiE